MRSRYKITDETPIYFITTSIHLWVPILFNESIFQILLNSLKYCRTNKGLNIHGYVIMTTHLHAIVSHQDPQQISSVIRDFKRHTATEIKAYLASLGQYSQLFWVKIFHNKAQGENRVWQAGYHPVAIWSPAIFEQKLNYLHFNPVEKGFVEKPEYWKYSSARNYLLGDDSLMSIDYLD
jgi:REP element-mobilizing transposase RayT